MTYNYTRFPSPEMSFTHAGGQLLFIMLLSIVLY